MSEKEFFKGKTVVITGASSGIGRALAYEFAANGANVVIGARHDTKLAGIAGDLTNRGAAVAWCAADVTREEDCRRLVETAVARFGGIDILVCNAGISMRALFDNVQLDVLRRLQAARGTVVGVSSVAGLHGLPGRTGYSASKYAMTGFLDTVRIENRRKGVHVMVACPGFTATNVRFSALTADGTEQGATPRKEEKMMTAEEVAHRIAKGIMRRKRLLLMEFEGRATHFIKKFSPRFLDMMFYKVMAREPDSPFK